MSRRTKGSAVASETTKDSNVDADTTVNAGSNGVDGSDDGRRRAGADNSGEAGSGKATGGSSTSANVSDAAKAAKERKEAERKERERLKRVRQEQRQALEMVRSKQNAEIARDSERAKKDKLAFLMQQADIFSHFVKASGDAPSGAEAAKAAIGSPHTPKRQRKTEAQEDKELLDANKEESGAATGYTHLSEQPPCIVDAAGKGRRMRQYQLEGLNWLINLYESGINGILADEMGLGKTLQTISLLGYLKEVRGIGGPHLIIVPKSTMHNWVKECNNWCPSLRVVLMHGAKDERARLIADKLVAGTFDVCVTSYEMSIIEKSALRKFAWRYLIIDEAHRIKNENSVLSQVVRIYETQARLLITGTPLQNNLHELWALLNFLLPEVFASADDFDEWFNLDDRQKEAQQAVVNKLHRVLRPFLLRRLKSDVESGLPPKTEVKLFVGLSDMQRDWYKRLLLKDIEAVNGISKQKMRLLNVAMQLRKCCNHPYLFDGAEQKDAVTGEYTTADHLVFNAGKMVVLDKLLPKLKENGSRVLIFSQMTRVLDVLEDYMFMRQYEYCRIDGNTSGEDREAQIEEFNAEHSSKFVFLLSTRAGGLGINLATADSVVLYDSDWNPQMDLQAQDRAHRIGQKRPVTVYRFVTEGTIEEKVVERAEAKLHLDALVVQQGRLQEQHKGVSKDELLSMIRFGADTIFKAEGGTVTDEDIDALIARGKEKTQRLAKETAEKFKDTNLSLSTFSSVSHGQQSLYEYQGTDYKQLQSKMEKMDAEHMLATWIAPEKRERRQDYSVDAYYRGVLNTGGPRGAREKQRVKPPKQPQIHDFQFYPPRLRKLLDKEMQLYRDGMEWLEKREAERAEKKAAEKSKAKKQGKGAEAAAEAEAGDVDEEEERQRDADEATMRDKYRLSEAEAAERDSLVDEGFGEWARRDFRTFLAASERHGRAALKEIARDVEGKSEAEVRRYAAVFWARLKELKDWERYVQQVERGEQRLERVQQLREVLRRKVERYANAWKELEIPYDGKAGKHYIEDEDVWLLCMTHELGYGYWEELKAEVRKAWQFRFDWFMKSRTPAELGRRVDQLLRMLEKDEKEADGGNANGNGSAATTTSGATGAATSKRKADAAATEAGAAPAAKKARKKGDASGAEANSSATGAAGGKKRAKKSGDSESGAPAKKKAKSGKAKEKKKSEKEETESEAIEDIVCKRCGSDANPGELVLCDGDCNTGYHLACMETPLRSLPKGDWFCHVCRPKKKKNSKK